MLFSARHDPELEPDAIRSLHSRIHPAFRGSPQYLYEGLSARAGIDVVLKIDLANPIRAFKGHGTWLVAEGLAGEGRIGPDRLAVEASAGNLGQRLAFEARSNARSMA